MSPTFALILTKRALCFALFLQALEIFRLARSPSEMLKIWSLQNLQEDFQKGLPLPPALISKMFSDPSLRWISGAQALIGFAGFLIPSLPVVGFLLISHVLICIRFRGLFNGGSDIMAVVVMTGLLMASIPNEKAKVLGLIYIAIHGLYSYVRAGHAKLIRPAWRNGSALPHFLQQSLFSDVRRISVWLRTRPGVSRLTGWGVLGFELSALAIPFFHFWAVIYFFAAMSFHLANVFVFGLNRFFWIWLAVWPAIFFSVNFIKATWLHG